MHHIPYIVPLMTNKNLLIFLCFFLNYFILIYVRASKGLWSRWYIPSFITKHATIICISERFLALLFQLAFRSLSIVIYCFLGTFPSHLSSLSTGRLPAESSARCQILRQEVVGLCCFTYPCLFCSTLLMSFDFLSGKTAFCVRELPRK